MLHVLGKLPRFIQLVYISFFLLRVKESIELLEYQRWNLKLQRVFSPLNLIFNAAFRKINTEIPFTPSYLEPWKAISRHMIPVIWECYTLYFFCRKITVLIEKTAWDFESFKLYITALQSGMSSIRHKLVISLQIYHFITINLISFSARWYNCIAFL